MTEHADGLKRYSVVVIGGGAGGTSVAARLRRLNPALDMVVIEPAEYHYYQPGWTLVGGGQFSAERTRRRVRDCIPASLEVIAERVESFDPERNALLLSSGATLNYRLLVVAAGIQLDWDAIEGLTETLGRNGVTSNYRYDLAPYTWQCIQAFRGGSALFTQPPMPIKCAGAPQKILYLAADYFKQHGISADLRFFTPGATMFGVPFYAQALDQVMAQYGASALFGHRLVKVDGPAKTAYFEFVANGNTTLQTVPFDLLHVVPPQSAPTFIKRSPLADAAGWLEVDKNTLQHKRYANIFGLGDCTSTPNSKTAAAVKNQMPVVVANVMRALTGQGAEAHYDGYASCPLTTSSRRVMLAEFCYDGVVQTSFPGDSRAPRRIFWWLKKTFLPFLYWRVVMQGRLWPIVHKPRAVPEALPPIEP